MSEHYLKLTAGIDRDEALLLSVAFDATGDPDLNRTITMRFEPVSTVQQAAKRLRVLADAVERLFTPLP